jgi:2-methylcitrate dehydratase PrpD
MTQRNSTANLFSDRTPVYRYEFNDPTSATVTGVGFAAADPAGDTAPSPSPTAAAQHRVEPVQQFGERSLVRSPYGNHVSTTIAQEHNCAFWAQTPMINPPAGPPGEARRGSSNP